MTTRALRVLWLLAALWLVTSKVYGQNPEITVGIGTGSGGGGGSSTTVTMLGAGAEVCVPGSDVACRSIVPNLGGAVTQNTNDIEVGPSDVIVVYYNNASGAPGGACPSGQYIGSDITNHRPYWCLDSLFVRLPRYDEVILASGTSGGIPYYSSSTTAASSAVLGANLPVIGGGAGAPPSTGTRSGNTTAFVTTTGAQTSGDCVKIDANGNHVANGSACGGGGAALRHYWGSFGNSGATIAATAYSNPRRVSAACTIGGWSISIPKADTGTATVKFVRTAAGTGSPGSGDEINTSGVSLSSGTTVYSTTVTDFTDTTLDAGDWIAVALTTVGGSPKSLTATIYCQE